MAVACRPVVTRETQESRAVDLLVVAPHPDDETLMAGPLLGRSRARGERVVVAVVTNGDASCKTSGFVRERETLEAMRVAGIDHDHVQFLGYPDGAVELLGEVPRRARRVDASGACSDGDTTYASAMDKVSTVSWRRTSSEQPYVRESLVRDLAWLLEQYRPRRIVTAHPADDHPDHAATGLAVLDAIERATAPVPKVSFSFVHLGPDYPADDGAGTKGVSRPREPMRALPEEFQALEVEERVAWVDAAPLALGPLLAAYRSQLGTPSTYNWLWSFDRADVPLDASAFVCDGSPRRCVDPRFSGPPAEAREVTGSPTAWVEREPLTVRVGTGVTVRAGEKHYRFCLRSRDRDAAELLIHDLTSGAELERRFSGLAQAPVSVRWVYAARGVAELDWADARGTFGRRLLAIGGPMAVTRATTCADVP